MTLINRVDKLEETAFERVMRAADGILDLFLAHFHNDEARLALSALLNAMLGQEHDIELAEHGAALLSDLRARLGDRVWRELFPTESILADMNTAIERMS